VLGTAWWLHEQQSEEEPPLVAPGQPLAMDEPVRMRWVDEETGEEDVWTVTKSESSPHERKGPALPEPDSSSATHQPDESSRALSAIALEAWKNGRILEAMDHLAAAIESDPSDPLPRTHYGRLLALSMEYRDALPHLERAAALRPDDPQVWLDLATVYQKMLVLDLSWEARRRADTLAEGREIRQGEMGFWVVDGNSIFP
jgi:tetratricopeptide (TPR) repeat protein